MNHIFAEKKKTKKKVRRRHDKFEITRFPVDVLGFEIPRLQQRQRQYGVARVVAQRAQELAAFVLSRRLKRLPKRRFLRQIDLRAQTRPREISRG